MAHDFQTRVEACRQATELLAGGLPLKKAAAQVGIPLGTLERWLRAWKTGGPDNLAADYSGVGRPAVAEGIPAEFRDFIRRKAAKCGSKALVYQYVVDDPACPEALREYLIPKLTNGKPLSLPLSLRRVANVTPELAAMYRSPVEFGHVGFKSRHSDLVIDPLTGQERTLLAGDIYLSDDMSTNHPFWFELPDGERETRAHRGDKLAEKFGVAVGRQGLYTNDARGKWLGAELIGRPTDAYTSADVLRHFRRILAEFGMPRIGWILEKGVWAARTVDGRMKVVFDDQAREAAVAGLASLGFGVEHVHTSEGKALIEGAFGHLQSVCDLLEIPTVGRKRGEMDRVERVMRQVQQGVIHPEDAGIPHIAAHVGNLQKAQVFCNGKSKHGVIQNGVPDQVWHQDTTAHPLRRLEPEHMGVFMPVKFQTMIRQGCVEKTIDGESFRFSAPELFARIGAGYAVAVAFDPGEPQAGAEIYNLETGSRNMDGVAPNAWLGHAELEAALPLFGYTPEVAASRARRKVFKRAFQSAYAGTGLFGKKAGRAVERREADGRLARMETNLGDAGGTEPVGRSRALPAGNEAGIPVSSFRRKQLTESDIDGAAAEAAALEERLRERGLLLPQ